MLALMWDKCETCLMSDDGGLRVEERDDGWALAGPAAEAFTLVNEYLGYLADRRYSSRTVRAYAHLCRPRHKWAYADRLIMPKRRLRLVAGVGCAA
jgi:integrase/recombinase XerD